MNLLAQIHWSIFEIQVYINLPPLTKCTLNYYSNQIKEKGRILYFWCLELYINTWKEISRLYSLFARANAIALSYRQLCKGSNFCLKLEDWRLVTEITKSFEMKCAPSRSSSFKSMGTDRIFPPLIYKRERSAE